MNSQIDSTTVSIANQTAVPSLVRKYLDIRSGDKLLWEIEPGEKRVIVKPSPKLWGKYMKGLGKKIWAGVNTKDYINKLRKDRI